MDGVRVGWLGWGFACPWGWEQGLASPFSFLLLGAMLESTLSGDSRFPCHNVRLLFARGWKVSLCVPSACLVLGHLWFGSRQGWVLGTDRHYHGCRKRCGFLRQRMWAWVWMCGKNHRIHLLPNQSQQKFHVPNNQT